MIGEIITNHKNYESNTIITVGLCVRNCEQTIEEVANGIVSQDFPHELMEIIIVDGYSSDRTVKIATEVFSKTKIKTSLYSENIGLGFARQIVVNNALGKYILWVDGDIILSNNYAKQLVDFMNEHPNVAISVGSLGIMQDDNWIALLETIGYVIESLKKQGKATLTLLGTKASILRTRAIRMIGGFDTNIKGAQEDVDVAEKLQLAGWKFFIINAVFYEMQKKTWNALWKRHFWYGYGLHFVKHKNVERNILTSKSNDWIILSSLAYKLTYRKVVFLMPLNFLFRKISLIFGFFMAHLDGYGHSNKKQS